MMKFIIAFFLTLFLFNLVYADTKTYGNLYNVQYVRNYDGDTITFNIPNVHPIIGDKISIRLYGIDTPEIKGKCSYEKDQAMIAKVVVQNLCMKAKQINLMNVRRGKYFRIVASVCIDNEDLTKILLDLGMGYVYYGGKKQEWCK